MSSGVVCGPEVRVRYSIASSRLSETSVSAMWWLFGIHSIPAETAVVPPRNSVRSRTRTRSPACAGGRAAHRAAPPEPRTITSTSLRGSIWFSTSEGRGKGSGLAGPALEPVQRERGDDHEAQRELLVEGLDVDEGEAGLERGDEHGAGDGAEHASFTAAERGAAHDRRGDRRQRQ